VVYACIAHRGDQYLVRLTRRCSPVVRIPSCHPPCALVSVGIMGGEFDCHTWPLWPQLYRSNGLYVLTLVNSSSLSSSIFDLLAIEFVESGNYASCAGQVYDVWTSWLPLTIEHGILCVFLFVNALKTPRSGRTALMAIMYRQGIFFYTITFVMFVLTLVVSFSATTILFNLLTDCRRIGSCPCGGTSCHSTRPGSSVKSSCRAYSSVSRRLRLLKTLYPSYSSRRSR
jgi:hypothetical protein